MLFTILSLLAFSLVIGGIAAHLRERERIREAPTSVRAIELLDKGASPVESFRQLVAEGTDEGLARKVVEKLMERWSLNKAAALLRHGATQYGAVDRMVAEGLDRKTATSLVGQAMWRIWCHRWKYVAAPAGVVFVIAGGIVILLGLVLVRGNQTGKMPTFPFAGFLTTLMGGSIAAVGITMMVSLLRGPP